MPRAITELLMTLAEKMPVVLTSRTGAGEATACHLRVCRSETDLLSEAKDEKDLPIGHSDVSQHSLGQYQSELLQGVVQQGTGHAAALQGFAAGKTGTTQDYRDALVRRI